MASTSTGIQSIRSGWRILLMSIALCCAGALLWSLLTTPRYRAAATFLVYPNANLTSSRDVVSSLDTLEGKTVSNTYADILGSQRVFQDTVERLDLDEAALRGVRVSAQVQKDTNILVLTVEGPNPGLNTLLANNLGQNGISFIKSIYQVFDIAFLDLAVEPPRPYHPQPALYTLAAAGIGLVLGLLFLVVRSALRLPLEQLKERAVTDRQSQAYTRRHLLRTLASDLARRADEPQPFGLISLQGLEDLAEGLPEGILAGLLQEVVRKLRNLLRGNDLVARWDKLTFSVRLPTTPEQPALKTFERLLQALEEPVALEGGEALQLSPVAALVIRRPDDTVESMAARGGEALDSARSGTSKLVLAK